MGDCGWCGGHRQEVKSAVSDFVKKPTRKRFNYVIKLTAKGAAAMAGIIDKETLADDYKDKPDD